MNDSNIPAADQESEQETYPVEPYYHPIKKIPRKIYNFLASAKLAMALLVAILICSVAGVTIVRGERASLLIFNSIWFNGILVLLVVNVACCFFGRVWHRRLTLISFGMILFHLSFVAILLGVVYNSLFYFRGNIRLTEGEVLRSSDPLSYDIIQQGLLFNFSRLRGETSLVRMHTGYKVGGEDKRAAYEVAVGDEKNRKQGIIYVTNKLTYSGVDYFNDKEGYSLLVTLSDRNGNIRYGGFLPLQSFLQGNEKIRYETGYREGDIVRTASIPFPAPPENPLINLNVGYVPSKSKERMGDVQFQLFPLDIAGTSQISKPYAEGTVPLGSPFTVGDYVLHVKEVRYWVAMTVRYEPGKPIVLFSLWIGLAGMVITTMGRMLKGRK
jgi:cytochrome c biogenesis protein ResB